MLQGLRAPCPWTKPNHIRSEQNTGGRYLYGQVESCMPCCDSISTPLFSSSSPFQLKEDTINLDRRMRGSWKATRQSDSFSYPLDLAIMNNYHNIRSSFMGRKMKKSTNPEEFTKNHSVGIKTGGFFVVPGSSAYTCGQNVFFT